MKQVPLRVDFAGAFLDVPRLARPEALIVNCAIFPLVSTTSWPYHRRAGLGGSAAWSMLTGRDAFADDLRFAGWQDPAVIAETGLCVWKSGISPRLLAKYDPEWLFGKMMLWWTGHPHDTAANMERPRELGLAVVAGDAAAAAAGTSDVHALGLAMNLSYDAQQIEGMELLPTFGAEIGRKYCGSGFGGYALYLFASAEERELAARVARPRCTFVEPYMRPAWALGGS